MLAPLFSPISKRNKRKTCTYQLIAAIPPWQSYTCPTRVENSDRLFFCFNFSDIGRTFSGANLERLKLLMVDNQQNCKYPDRLITILSSLSASPSSESLVNHAFQEVYCLAKIRKTSIPAPRKVRSTSLTATGESRLTIWRSGHGSMFHIRFYCEYISPTVTGWWLLTM